MADQLARAMDALTGAMQRLGDKLVDVHLAIVASISESQLARAESAELRNELSAHTDELRRARHEHELGELAEHRHTAAMTAANGG